MARRDELSAQRVPPETQEPIERRTIPAAGNLADLDVPAALLHERGLEIPAGMLQPPHGRPGRPPSATTKDIHAEWVKMNKPKITAGVCDRIAKVFFSRELHGMSPGSAQHRKVRERVRQALQRVERCAAT